MDIDIRKKHQSQNGSSVIDLRSHSHIRTQALGTKSEGLASAGSGRSLDVIRRGPVRTQPLASTADKSFDFAEVNFIEERTEEGSHNFLRQAERNRHEGIETEKRSRQKEEKSCNGYQQRSDAAKILRRRSLLRFAVSSFLIPVIIFTFSFAQSQFERKGKVLGESTAAYEALKSAAGFAFASDFALTGNNLDSANMNFAKARETIDGIGLGVGETVANLPIDTPISTAQNLASAGENITAAGKDLSDLMSQISSSQAGTALLGKLEGTESRLASASSHLKNATENLRKVDTGYIPEDMKPKIELAKETLPVISSNFEKLAEDYPLISRMLGSDREQKYLILFENNSEMRATGGFIGSYGILEIENGEMKSLSIDGIFNPDGQLKEKIVPPMPIQKISASWSMHDANWFADYPTSAKKIALLYEKTGAPTVDGVIAITPETIKKLLAITGPIEMPDYGTTITADNFIAETQNQVESLYDKEENRPKKILSELAPILIDRVLKGDNGTSEDRAAKLLDLISVGEGSLREKHILIYHRDEAIEAMLKKRGWAGEVIQNETGDYLSVINSNINGYKTDAVVEEKINLKTDIQEDGTIINTLTINRKHTGGDSEYDWYNRVNADYMRVFVPKGSLLLEASGNTVEQYTAPMDYASFKTDPDVAAIEGTIKIDPESGTQVFEEAGKTVFGNWVYVSPKEEVTITYRYQLPFKIDFAAGSKETDAYSAIIQKQSGSIGSSFDASISFPQTWQSAWKTDKVKEGNTVSEKLTRDMIYAFVFVRN